MARVCSNWCFTSFAVKCPVWDVTKMSYLTYQQEKCPTTGKLHWQGYVKALERVGHKKIQEIIGDPVCHVEILRGKPGQAAAYCHKDETAVEGTRAEFGALPKDMGKRTDLDAFRDAIMSGMSQAELLQKHLGCMAKYQPLYKLMLLEYSKKRKYVGDERPVLEFHIGPTGSGKSRAVFEKYPDAYNWSIDNGGGSTWISNYKGEEVIILDEYRGELRFKALKELCGWNPYSFQSKFGDVQILAKKFVFTSTTHPNDWYPDPEGEWARRVAEFGVEYKYEGESVVT